MCRLRRISSALCYKYTLKNRGMEASDAKQLRAPEGVTGKLKKLLVVLMLENVTL